MPEKTLGPWAEVCARFETLIAAWLAQAAVPGARVDETEAEVMKRQREWASTLAAVSMAAQRALGLRMALIDFRGEESDDATAGDPAERRHWRAIEADTATDEE
jgi:hypothetical protein